MPAIASCPGRRAVITAGVLLASVLMSAPARATLQDLGDPTQTTTYELCVYDSTGTVRLAMSVAPGAGWSFLGSSLSPRGYKYRDRLALQRGIKKINLQASSTQRARLQVGGKGLELPDTQLPFILPVTAQLYASDGMCWDAEFGPPETRRNLEGGYSGKRRAP